MPRYLVTSALPYANGPSHLGQIAGAYLPADIFVRYLKLAGEEVVFICGTDEHGKPITQRARREGVTPEAVVARYHAMIADEFARFGIEFDNFSGTARPHHIALSQAFFLDLLRAGALIEEGEEIFWCPKCDVSLADRDIEGVCPRCKDHIARGDECKRTGSWLQATDLIEPRCAICGTPPERRQTRSHFLDLPAIADRISAWLDTKTWWKDNVLTFVRAWIRDGLHKRSVTRDMSWGVPVPVAGLKNKVLYVWLDAPIGYISSTVEWAEKIGDPERWKRYWLDDPAQPDEVRLVHFIGKDNIAFHAVTWPATLIARNQVHAASERLVLPYDIPANEFLTLGGEPFSTGLNWAVWTGEALDAVDADVLRWTLAANAPESKDADFTWEEVRDRNNIDLADTFGNLASRTFRFIEKYQNGVIPPLVAPSALDLETLETLARAPAELAKLYSTYKVRAAAAAIMEVARVGNRYYDLCAPWLTRTNAPQAAANCMHVCSRILRALAVIAWPIIPNAATRLFAQLSERGTPGEWRLANAAAADPDLSNRKLGEIAILFAKLDDEFVETQNRKLRAASQKEKKMESKSEKPGAGAASGASAAGAAAKSPASTSTAPAAASAATATAARRPEITYDDFAKLEIRIGLVKSAERIPKADKLLKLQVEIGGETRQVLAGVAESYAPEELVGKRVPILVNLAPRKIRGEISQGMMLAADLDGAAVLLHPVRDVPPGSTVK